jgi:hypothetical protein
MKFKRPCLATEKIYERVSLYCSKRAAYVWCVIDTSRS